MHYHISLHFSHEAHFPCSMEKQSPLNIKRSNNSLLLSVTINISSGAGFNFLLQCRSYLPDKKKFPLHTQQSSPKFNFFCSPLNHISLHSEPTTSCADITWNWITSLHTSIRHSAHDHSVSSSSHNFVLPQHFFFLFYAQSDTAEQRFWAIIIYVVCHMLGTCNFMWKIIWYLTTWTVLGSTPFLCHMTGSG